MTDLVLNEQAWLSLLYFVVLPLLVVGVGIATVQRRAGPKQARQGASSAQLGPLDPTPMVDDDRPVRPSPVRAGERLLVAPTPTPVDRVVLGGPVEERSAEKSAPAPRPDDSDQRRRLGQLESLNAIHQDTIQQLRKDLQQREQALQQMAQLTAELSELRQTVAELRAERDAMHMAIEQNTTAMALLNDDTENDEDDDIVVPMPAAVSDMMDLEEDEPEELPGPSTLALVDGPSEEGALAVSDLPRLAMVFDGTPTPVVVEPAFHGLSNGGWTIEGWVLPHRSRMSRAWVSYFVAGSTRVSISAGGTTPSLNVSIDGRSLAEDEEPGLTPDQWQHISLSWDATDGRLTVYLDGGLAYSGEIAPNARIPSGGRLAIGQEFAPGTQMLLPSRAFLGALAEVRIWTHVRTPAAIQRDATRRVRRGTDVHIWRAQ